jgi:hypothetical protein
MRFNEDGYQAACDEVGGMPQNSLLANVALHALLLQCRSVDEFQVLLTPGGRIALDYAEILAVEEPCTVADLIGVDDFPGFEQAAKEALSPGMVFALVIEPRPEDSSDHYAWQSCSSRDFFQVLSLIFSSLLAKGVFEDSQDIEGARRFLSRLVARDLEAQ